MTTLLQSVSPSVRREAGVPPVLPLWQLVLLSGIIFWLYRSILIHLVLQWWKSPDFSHGFFVPLFSALVIWQDRKKLASLPVRPSWSGLAIAALGMCTLVVGQLGAELFLSRASLLILLAGLIVLFYGWTCFRALCFPWAFLFLMIPIPNIVLNQITFPLQLLASRVAAEILPVLGIPVLREGNVIVTSKMPLQVAEACSGIRSLMTLIALAIIYGYLMEKRRWVRWLLALASIPIAVAANSVRIVGTGLLVEYWNPELAEGNSHTFWGLIIFVISLVMLYALHGLINRFVPDGSRDASFKDRSTAPSGGTGMLANFAGNPQAHFVLSALMVLAVAIFLQVRVRNEVFPPRRPLRMFPSQLANWEGTDENIDSDTLEILGPGDYLRRTYQDAELHQPAVDLFIAYVPSQRAGDTLHSPRNCFPGAGWTPIQSRRVLLSMVSHAPFQANRLVFALGDSRQLILYWYWSHDRGVAGEYWSKYYLVTDSIKMNRSDGALVRLGTVIGPGETADEAEQRLLPFADRVLPLLHDYIPR